MHPLACVAGLLIAAALLAACDMPGPDPPPPPPPPPQMWEGPRTMSFERVAALNNEVVLDLELDVDGVSLAVTRPSASGRKVWIDDGAGWRVLTADYSATCAAKEPGTNRVFVGLESAQYTILRTDGSVVLSQTAYDVAGVGTSGWATRRCQWIPEVGGFVVVTLSADHRLDGALLYLDARNLDAGVDWVEPRVRIQHPTWPDAEEHAMGFDGLSISRAANGSIGVGAGIAYGTSAHALTQRMISGSPFSDAPWTILDAPQDAAGYGAPRDFGSYPAHGSATLYRDLFGGQWRAIVTTPAGYSGVTRLHAPELNGSALALDVDREGHLWIGGDGGLGLWRSVDVLQ